MINFELFEQPGEHALMLEGNVGAIEATLTVPQNPRLDYFALLGHPHSLQGGSMNNKVVTTMARTFRDLAIPSLRFNFRGVGQTAGRYDDGLGESEDMLLVLDELKKTLVNAKYFIAGFSFGSYVAYRCACQSEPHALLSIAPPVHHYDFEEFNSVPKQWIVFQGLEDGVVSAEVVKTFFERQYPEAEMHYFEQTGHFFHGKLVDFKNRLTPLIEQLL